MANFDTLKQPQFYLFKIMEIKNYTPDNYWAVIKISGSDELVEEKPINLIEDDCLIQGFSPLDVRTLTLLACIELHFPSQSIVAYDFSQPEDETVFHIKERHKKYVVKKKLSELYADRQTLSEFDPIDAYRIGYFHGLNRVTFNKD